jgi:hypothetical protein
MLYNAQSHEDTVLRCEVDSRAAQQDPVTYFCLSIRLSECISAVPTGRISVKFDIVDFYENLSRKSECG